MTVDWDLDFPVPASWDNGGGIFAFKVLPDGIGVIALIGYENFGRWAALHDEVIALVIGDLATG